MAHKTKRLVSNKYIDEIIDALREALKDLPDPSVTLVGKKWKSPYLVLISCIMSLRTKDETTLPASERLFARASTPKEMIELSVKEIEKLIYPVGFFRNKAKQIKQISQQILEEYDGRTPDTIEELLKFKGVGRKTANLTIIEGYGKPGICVDTHVHRISNRIGYVETDTPDDTEWALRKKLPKEYWIDYNAMLVTWGQNMCRPISPLCSRCPIKHICQRNGVEKSR